MAKRFTDTGKWAKASFSELSSKLKLVWIYLCDNCNHAGIWDINLGLMSYQVGEPVTLDEIEQGFGDKVRPLSATKLFIPSFVDFQYGILNPDNRAHKSVLEMLRKEGANKVLTRSSRGRKDKDKEKDKDKVLRGGVGEFLDALYSRYPRKLGKADGIARLKAALKAGATFEELDLAMDRTLAHHAAAGTGKEFVPYFSTWTSTWRDWLDPEAGKSEDFSKEAGHDWAAITAVAK